MLRNREPRMLDLRVGTLNAGTMKGKETSCRKKGRFLCVHNRPGERATRLEAMEEDSSCTIMVWIGK